MIDPGLTGRVALVTGANHGIGAATARALAEHGAHVLLTYLRLDPERDHDRTALPAYREARARSADAVVDEIVSAGGRAAAREANLADPSAARELFDWGESVFGPVEILVNNASSWKADTFLPEERDRFGRELVPLDAETHDLHFLVNSRATALLIAEFARRHVARRATWGRIVSITTGGSGGFPGEVSYGASKNALESYTIAAALELGAYGITANVVCPAATDTGWVTPEIAAAVARGSPLGHVGEPEDVAEVIVFLASGQARWITGEKLALR